MTVWVGQQTGEHSIAYPRICVRGQDYQGEDPREYPDVGYRGYDSSFLELFGYPGDNEEVDRK